MRVTIFGAGALGSVIGALMADSNIVSLVGREDHAREINADGLWLDGLTERRTFPQAAVTAEDLPQQELVIVTVKAYDTRTALRSIGPLLGDDTAVLLLQNGLTVLEEVKECPGALIGTASLGAQYIGPGHVRLTGLGEIVVGDPSDPDDLCGTVLESFHSTDVPIRRSLDMTRDVWRKAVISSCINPLTAITRKTNAVIFEDRGINDLARECFGESALVGASSNHLGGGDVAFSDVEKVAKATAGNRSSMLQDVERGRRTEIGSINGEMVRIGSKTDIDVRVNRMLVRIVSAMASKQGANDY